VMAVGASNPPTVSGYGYLSVDRLTVNLRCPGIHVLASRLVGVRSRPLAVRESCCDIISNLALGAGAAATATGGAGTTSPPPPSTSPLADREAQAALTAAGAGPALAKMLSLRNVQVGRGEG
jgi:hypothetical protein